MKRLYFLIIAVAFGCTNKTHTSAIHISLIYNKQALKISGLNSLIIKEIARDTSNHFESFLPVCKLPADTDLKNYQPQQPGHYTIKDSAIIFTPDTPFTKQQSYFIRYYQYGEDGDITDFIKGYKNPGKLRFIDLIFKQ